MSIMSLRTDELDYDLPRELIATKPAEPRDSARLLVMSRSRPDIEHRTVRDLPDYLRAGDALILNDTAVMPARIVGRHADTGGRIEGLFLAAPTNDTWEVMLRSGRPLRAHQRLELFDHKDQPSGVVLKLRETANQSWLVSVEGAGRDGDVTFQLGQFGRTPLPPYIVSARGLNLVDDSLDRGWYQTTYANLARRHSVAAPTAGLHFTPELLARIESRGVQLSWIALHVGPGTFKPVTADDLSGHVMHRERFEIDGDTVRLIQKRISGAGAASAPSSRVLAVGTTVVRAIESLPGNLEEASAGLRGETDLLIAPPYSFRFVDGMLTNFHLPRSTLLALVAAMVGLGRIKAVYREAIDRGYRFYSYGDAMLILP